MSQNQNGIHEVFPYLRVKGAKLWCPLLPRVNARCCSKSIAASMASARSSVPCGISTSATQASISDTRCWKS